MSEILRSGCVLVYSSFASTAGTLFHLDSICVDVQVGVIGLERLEWMCSLPGSGLSAYNKIVADDVKIGQAESFKIFVDNTEWDNFIVSFKDLPGYATYNATLMSYKTVSLTLFAGLGRICIALTRSTMAMCPTMRL